MPRPSRFAVPWLFVATALVATALAACGGGASGTLEPDPFSTPRPGGAAVQGPGTTLQLQLQGS